MKIIADADLLQDVTDALQAFVVEARIQFLDELIRIWVVDPANAAATYIDMKPSQMDRIQHYSVQEDGLLMGLNLDKLDGYLGYADSGQPVQMAFGEAHNWAFNIQLPGVDANVAGIDPESIRNEPDKPDLDWNAQFRLPGSDVKNAQALNDMVSDHSTIRVGDHTVQFIAEGDTDDNTYSLTEGESELEFFEHPDEAVESMVSLDYLDDMVKVLKGWDVTMKVDSEMPVMFETDLFTMMLAPRIQSQ